MTLSGVNILIKESDYVRFSNLVQDISGLSVPDARKSDLKNAILNTMMEFSIQDTDMFYDYLHHGSQWKQAQEILVAQMTVGESHFFRNKPQFKALEQHVLPELIKKRTNDRRLRIWSVGCAAGEEPYSIAILLNQLIPDIERWNTFILATDINRKVLEKATQGSYGKWSFREVPAGIQDKYFVHVDSSYVLMPEIRRMVTFRYLNLVEDGYPSLPTDTLAMDLILFRNVMIYFNENTSLGVVNRLYRALVEEGWLAVGHTEVASKVFHQFALRSFPGTFLFQKQAAVRESGQRYDKPAAIPAPTVKPVARKRQTTKPRKPVRRVTPEKGISDRLQVLTLSLPVPESVQKAETLIEQGLYKEAQALLEKAAAENPADVWAPYCLAKLYANRLDYKNALHWIDIVLEKAPFLVSMHYLKALVYLEEGQYMKSLVSLRACNYADPEFLLAYYTSAEIYTRLQQNNRALGMLDRLLGLLSGRPDEALVLEGEGMTVKQLLDLADVQKELLAK